MDELIENWVSTSWECKGFIKEVEKLWRIHKPSNLTPDEQLHPQDNMTEWLKVFVGTGLETTRACVPSHIVVSAHQYMLELALVSKQHELGVRIQDPFVVDRAKKDLSDILALYKNIRVVAWNTHPNRFYQEAEVKVKEEMRAAAAQPSM